jgi:hypothetical protein
MEGQPKQENIQDAIESKFSPEEKEIIEAVDLIGSKLKRFLEGNKAFQETLTKDEYDVFISDEVSARFVTLIIRKLYSLIHEKSPETYFINSGRHRTRSDNGMYRFLEALDEKRKQDPEHKKVLFVSEFINKGHSAQDAMSYFDLFSTLKFEQSDVFALERGKEVGNANDKLLVRDIENKGYVSAAAYDHSEDVNLKEELEKSTITKKVPGPKTIHFGNPVTGMYPDKLKKGQFHRIFFPETEDESNMWRRGRADTSALSLALGVGKRMIKAPLEDVNKDGQITVDRKGYSHEKDAEAFNTLIGTHPVKIEELIKKPNSSTTSYVYSTQSAQYRVDEESSKEIERIIDVGGIEAVHDEGEEVTPEVLEKIARYKKIARDQCNYWAEKIYQEIWREPQSL